MQWTTCVWKIETPLWQSYWVMLYIKRVILAAQWIYTILELLDHPTNTLWCTVWSTHLMESNLMVLFGNLSFPFIFPELCKFLVHKISFSRQNINVLVALTCQILAGHFEPLYSNATILFYHKYSMRRLAFRFFSSGINFHNMGLKNVRHSSNAKTVHQCVTCET